MSRPTAQLPYPFRRVATVIAPGAPGVVQDVGDMLSLYIIRLFGTPAAPATFLVQPTILLGDQDIPIPVPGAGVFIRTSGFRRIRFDNNDPANTITIDVLVSADPNFFMGRFTGYYSS